MLFRCLGLCGLVVVLTVTACGDNDSNRASLDDFLPPIPEPTGGAAAVSAGAVTAADLLPGQASSGMVGDFFIRNSRASFIIQSPSRVMGVIPQGGNLVDAVPLGPDGQPLTEDHLGEVSMMYLLGRTCEHQTVEVVQDGSGGGVAAIVARGVAAPNDFVNLKGTGILPIAADLDPVPPDDVECATTYILEPDSPDLKIYWTLFNGGERRIEGPFAALSDTGGNIETWAPTRGFERLGVEAIAGGVGAAPIDYDVFQGPGVAYGLTPIHASAEVNSAYLIAGISVMLFGTDTFLDALRPEGFYVDLLPAGGVTNRLVFTVGHDAADVEESVRTITGEATVEISGTVTMSSGAPAAGVRVGLFSDDDGDGAIGPDDLIRSYFDTTADGSFGGRVMPGEYLLRADLYEVARSTALAVSATADQTGLAIELPDPVLYDYTVTDDVTGDPLPAKLTVIGDHPALPDHRVHSTYDRLTGVVTMLWATHGTTVDIGDGADGRLALPAGGTYRVFATHGPEWSFASEDLDPVVGDPVGDLSFALRHVVDTTGYVASEYHVHSIGSPDSPVPWERRIETAVADGVELWASTEHEYIAELQPLIETMGLGRWTRSLVGEEASPFTYGHYIGFPLTPDPDSPVHGAVDWAAGANGYGLLPGEVMQALRDLGAEVVQVNHPRVPPLLPVSFMEYFDRIALTFDFDARTVGGDPLKQPVPNDYMRLEPGQEVWSPDFNALEVWNNLDVLDTNDDGVRDLGSLDRVTRDWFNFLSLGMVVTPMGNSDTHTTVKDPMGIPRTLVRVDDDSAEALASGSLVASLYDTLTGRTARDVIVGNGPMIRVTEAGQAASVIGREVDGTGGVTLAVAVQSAAWIPFDTIEVFANATPAIDTDDSHLEPLLCYTTRAVADMAANDPCKTAPLGVQALTVQTVALGGGFERLEAQVDVALTGAEIAGVTRPGASGSDAWVVVRVRGQSGVFPLHIGKLLVDTLDTMVRGTPGQVAAALVGAGLPATAFTAAILVDFDGGGYLAPFAPQ